MKIVIVGRITEVNSKNGVTYAKMLDKEQGGMFQIGIPGAQNLEIDQVVKLDAEVKPGIGQYGLYLKVVSINTNKEVKE